VQKAPTFGLLAPSAGTRELRDVWPWQVTGEVDEARPAMSVLPGLQV
jgi:hypothetical protein